ncbi:glutathione S-transferase [Bosea sp. OK403]|uniref:glutathione S-transferase family protein n=1 Tax=Bosea sp. OK403 TaxID=1855286 RepID=UPI0008E13616|nr:glutathione S-transferase family protein [Bosea sp. OK403]SFI83102.1 glutathione S-transferase [Bosea sp. OK403]
MALTIYGSPRSRTMRTLWMAEELGIDYDHVSVNWDDPWLKTDEFLTINPAGAVPTIDHNGFGLGESLAINLYLAKTFSPPSGEGLYPSDPRVEANVWRWSLWAQQHLEPWVRRDGGKPVYSGATAGFALAEAHRELDRLDATLAARDWLAADRFTVADFNVACVLSPSRTPWLEMERHTPTAAWLERCYGRPAARSVRARFNAAPR